MRIRPSRWGSPARAKRSPPANPPCPHCGLPSTTVRVPSPWTGLRTIRAKPSSPASAADRAAGRLRRRPTLQEPLAAANSIAGKASCGPRWPISRAVVRDDRAAWAFEFREKSAGVSQPVTESHKLSFRPRRGPGGPPRHGRKSRRCGDASIGPSASVRPCGLASMLAFRIRGR